MDAFKIINQKQLANKLNGLFEIIFGEPVSTNLNIDMRKQNEYVSKITKICNTFFIGPTLREDTEDIMISSKETVVAC